MLKWTRRAAIFLLLGAIVNVAVAWGCVFVHRDITPRQLISKGHKPGNRFEALGSFRFGFEYVTDWGFYHELDQHISDDEMEPYLARKWWPGNPRGDESAGAIHHLGCGWPMLALAATVRFDRFIAGSGPVEVIDGVPLEPPQLTVQRGPIPMIVPFRPLWTGFAINTLAYGLLLALLVLGRSAIMRAIRRGRGQCLNCGYPRGTSPVCTECGEALP